MGYKKNAYLWLFQRISGAVLLIIIIMHFVQNHLVNHVLNYEVVVKHVSNPIVKAIEIIFLILCVFHGLSGTKGIIADLPISEKTEKILSKLFCTVGIILVAVGLWIIVPL